MQRCKKENYTQVISLKEKFLRCIVRRICASSSYMRVYIIYGEIYSSIVLWGRRHIFYIIYIYTLYISIYFFLLYSLIFWGKGVYFFCFFLSSLIFYISYLLFLCFEERRWPNLHPTTQPLNWFPRFAVYRLLRGIYLYRVSEK